MSHREAELRNESILPRAAPLGKQKSKSVVIVVDVRRRTDNGGEEVDIDPMEPAATKMCAHRQKAEECGGWEILNSFRDGMYVGIFLLSGNEGGTHFWHSSLS